MFRTYIYQLQPTKKQSIIFHSLESNIKICYEFFSNLFKEYKDGWITMYSEVSDMFFSKHKFSSYFINNIFNQLIDNFSSSNNKASIQSVFPLSIKGTSFNNNRSKINLPFLQDVKLSHVRNFNGKAVSYKLFYNNSKFYIHILIKLNNVSKKTNNLSVVGIDMGLAAFATLSTGVMIDNPRFERRLLERIKFHQSRLSNKSPHSLAWEKEVNRINALHKKIKRQKQNFFHQISNYLIKNFDVIGIENLAIGELQSHKHLRSSLKDASWGEFIRILEYKCEQEGKYLIKVGRFFPSSQICSSCGSRKVIPLSQRVYQCNCCGKHINRDYNASINIESRAINLFSSFQ